MSITAPSTAPASEEAKLHDLVAALTVEQKTRLVTGASFWTIAAEPDAGLRTVVMSDGPAGVRGQRWDERDPSLNIPTPIALAATWDEAAVADIAALLAADARRQGVHVLLAPAINLHRSPAGGRNFEYFSEDPVLTGLLTVSFVKSIQSYGVAATLKHFVGNDSETDRFVVDAQIDERTLREVYLAPFEEGVAAGAWAVMAAYNLVNGQPMTEHPMLNAVLRDEWQFDGIVVSDWYAVRSVVESGSAGLDLAMPGPESPWSRNAALTNAVYRGDVAESELDEKVLRILRLASRVGQIDGAAPSREVVDLAAAPAILRRVAADGMTLLHNTGPKGTSTPILPLDTARIGSIAIVGPAATPGRTLGGGSATVYPEYLISPLEGIREAVDTEVDVHHARGLRFGTRHPLAEWSEFRADDDNPGLGIRFLRSDGSVAGEETRRNALFKWLGAFQPGVERAEIATIEVGGRFVPSETGPYLIGCSGMGEFKVLIDGMERLATTLALPDSTDPIEGLIRPPQGMVAVDLVAGQETEVIISHRVDHSALTSKVEVNVAPPSATEDAEIDKAVQLAAESDIAIVVVGTDAEIETESMDRASLSLPGRQDELVRRVAAVNPRTIVVINAGAPVLTPWAADVAAVLVSWFPGQEFGNSLADVLLGQREPGGRLPLSWPASWGEHQPSTLPVEGALHYSEGLLVGYRDPARQPETQFPFGFGLGYTSWDVVDGPTIVRASGGGWYVSMVVRNTGTRAGKYVAQVYASAPESAVERPARWLAGVRAVEVPAAGHARITISIPERRLQHWDAEKQAFILEDTSFRLSVATDAWDEGITVHVS
ncbi:glycoside hydrolase family 3 C-terminal domain-containing protein [Microbacterium trichothecenolyticum]|uniref:beta-glucosidase family protein n=1 Tax=Microbacterium trichothecenolyticum TaxID=69370 RepID=UPI001C6E19BD|nr:glycoside hydrolase family 3 C-terminal domain-containing protein [Microbacterium trichothecenolyticum]MBW9122068.1 glycoside hydrolase family 3 C-terminal domain-containing protein [Microbacterium trichothecenolyticum]